MDQVSFGALALYLSGVVVANEVIKRRQKGAEVPVVQFEDAIKTSDPVTPPACTPSSGRKKTAFTGFVPSMSSAESAASASNDGLFMLSPTANSASLVAPLVERIDTTSENGGIIVIGIAGGSGSGKTTLAKAIYDTIGMENISFISHDSYYKDLSHLRIEDREKENFDHPNSLDTALLVEHVRALKRGQHVDVPTYDFKTHSRTNVTVPLVARPVILVEGILIFSDPALYNEVDIRIFVDTDDDIRLIRRLQRDTVERGRTLSSVINQYIRTVRPMHLQYVEPSKRNADIIVPVGLNSVALDLVVSKLKSHLNISL